VIIGNLRQSFLPFTPCIGRGIVKSLCDDDGGSDTASSRRLQWLKHGLTDHIAIHTAANVTSRRGAYHGDGSWF